MKENELQRRCILWVRQYHKELLIVNIHGDGYTNKGFPDLLVFGGGKAVAIELKADSGYQPQPDQILWRNRFLNSGTPHYYCDNFNRFKAIIQDEFNLPQDKK